MLTDNATYDEPWWEPLSDFEIDVVKTYNGLLEESWGNVDYAYAHTYNRWGGKFSQREFDDLLSEYGGI